MAGPTADERRRIAEILQNFAARLPDTLDRMNQAAVAGDGRGLARLAHGLKGSSATLGANRFAALCGRRWRAGRQDGPSRRHPA